MSHVGSYFVQPFISSHKAWKKETNLNSAAGGIISCHQRFLFEDITENSIVEPMGKRGEDLWFKV